MVPNVIGGDHGVCSEGMLYFKIPLNIFRILQVAADVIQVRNGKGTLRVEATAKLLSCAGVTTAARTARCQTSAAIVIRQKGAIALGHQVHAAARKCSGSRRGQVEGHASQRGVEQVYLREIRIKQAQEAAGIKVGKEAHAPANNRILADGAPSETEPGLENNFLDARDDCFVAGGERDVVGNRQI